MPRKATSPSIADQNAAPGGAAAVDRALSVLTAFRSGDKSLSLHDFSQRTQLYKSTLLRLLASLEHAEFIQRLPDGRYALAASVARLNGLYLASFSLADVVQPALRSLVATTGESAAYHVRQGHNRLCLYRENSPSPIQYLVRAGDILPINRGTGGRILMAFDPPPEIEISKADVKRYQKIRAAGFVASIGDNVAEVAGISAPVWRPNGQFAAALTLTMPAHRFNEAHIPIVMQAARALGDRLV